MKRLVIATNNAEKVKEIKSIIGGFYDEVLSLKEAGLLLNVVEDGKSFEENAKKKAIQAYEITGCDTIADDSGLCVDALGGAPGIYSARYAGENATDEDNNNKLLWEMRGVKDRSAKFVCVMVLASKKGIITARGEVHGIIAYSSSGEGGFGYDPLFFSEKFGQTFGELPEGIKNSISHRYRALAELKAKVTEQQSL